MVSFILAALIGLLSLIVYDYFHQRPNYSFEKNALKYTMAFIIVAFGFSFLIAWKYFQYLQVAAAVIAFGLLFSIIINFIESAYNWVISKFKKK